MLGRRLGRDQSLRTVLMMLLDASPLKHRSLSLHRVPLGKRTLNVPSRPQMSALISLPPDLSLISLAQMFMGSRRRSQSNLLNQASLLNQAHRPLESVPPREGLVDARKRHRRARLAHWLLLGLMMMQAFFRVGGQMMTVDEER